MRPDKKKKKKKNILQREKHVNVFYTSSNFFFSKNIT